MELNVDLLKEKRKKSLYRVIFGILQFLFAGSWIIIKLFENEVIKFFDWIFVGVFVVNGVINLAEGLGYSFENFFGKAFILINSEIISLKASIFDKNQSVKWSEIKSIDYKRNIIEIKKNDQTTIIVNLSRFDYISREKIERAINYYREQRV